ncbi:MAG: Hsp70 family protein [Deltaproteobacteria bacterium]|jgi:molecular chaperone DnaK (HSP70)|nr:Hsp70 family protein [Deltaproteobacteria bacterium]
MRDQIYGIDFGTSHTRLSVLKDGAPRIVPIDGNQSLPSYLAYARERLDFGGEAIETFLTEPGATLIPVKAALGRDQDPALTKAARMRPQDFAAHFLSRVAGSAGLPGGHKVRRAVISVPASLGDAQRRLIMEAAELAGIEPVRLVSDASALALAIMSGPDELPDGFTALVCDMGGGRFNASVVRLGPPVETLSSLGDDSLGGWAFDVAISRRILADVGGALRPGALQGCLDRLAFPVAKAKELLSTRPGATVWLGPLRAGALGDAAPVGDFRLTPELYGELCADLADRAVNLALAAVREASLTPDGLGKVILTGGMSRSPLIQRRFAKAFGPAKLAAADPDVSVPFGAAVMAGILGGLKDMPEPVEVTARAVSSEIAADGLSRPNGGQAARRRARPALGTRTECLPIIPANSPLPALRRGVYGFNGDSPEVGMIKLYLGDDPSPAGNEFLGQIEIYPGGGKGDSTLILEYSLDANGIFRVTPVRVSRPAGLRIAFSAESLERCFEANGKIPFAKDPKGFYRPAKSPAVPSPFSLLGLEGLARLAGDPDGQGKAQPVNHHVRRALASLGGAKRPRRDLSNKLHLYRVALSRPEPDGGRLDDLERELKTLIG